MTSLLRSTLTVSVLLQSVAFAQAWTPKYAVGAGQKPRSCSTSSFTLEVPTWASGLPASFDSAFGGSFTADPRWFGLSAGFIRPTLTPVLPEYSGTNVPVARRDGHRRSFVIGFVRLQLGFPTSTWVSVPPVREEYACAVVSALREAVTRVQGVTITDGLSRQAPLLISRSCDTVVQDAESRAAPSTLTWPATRMSAAPSPGLPQIDVALIDTGIDPAYRASMGVVPNEVGLPAFERSTHPEYHPHGAQMAALIHSIAPNARIRSYRALDGRGMGSLQSIARAVDDAIFDPAITTGTRKPLVVNLSVGAPPDISAPSLLSGVAPDGSSCSTWEDGAGETLRYVLNVAGQFEQQQQQGVFVVASSGNSPLEFASTSVGSSIGGVAATPCTGVNTTFTNTSSFFPAALGERASCRGGQTWLPVLAIGASTWDDRRSSVTRIRTEPRVYAPGERVFAVNSLFPAAANDVSCGETDVGYAHALESPGTVTGTSASAALTAGAAAHLMGWQYWGPAGTGWRAADLGRLLYLTGQPVCFDKASVGKGRRVSIARAVQALSTTACSALRSCLRSASHPAGPMVNDSTAPICASAMNTCFGAAATLACTPITPEPGWAGYETSIVSGGVCSMAWNAPPGARIVAPLAVFPDQQLSGLGPQPSSSGCPNCSILLGRSFYDAMQLRFELTDALPRGTQIQDAFVTVLDENKNVVESVSVSDGNTWYPGFVGQLKIPFSDTPPDVLYEYLQGHRWLAVIDLGVTGRDGQPARLISPLRVEQL